MTPKSNAFYNLKKKIIGHVLGYSSSGDAHILARRGLERRDAEEKKIGSLFTTIIRCGLTVIKSKAAGCSLEQQIGTLAAEGVDVGTIGHSR